MIVNREGAASSTLHDRADELSARYAGRNGADLMRIAIAHEFPGRIALVSSFGTESAVLLALAAEVDPAVPVIFLDTGRHFGETLRYRDRLVARLGLKDVRSIGPEDAVDTEDRDGMLWHRDSDRCCFLRKVLPLRRALEGFDAWITGRKRYQGGLRTLLTPIEVEDGHIKFNPLANWSREDIDREFAARSLPRHPLEQEGFLSIGCMPCTARLNSEQDGNRRAGRWPGTEKTECGIHLSAARAGLA